MFGLSFWEIAIIMVIALVVLGPSKLPEIARNLGKGLREFRKATDDFKSTVSDEIHRPEPPRYALPDTPAQIIPSSLPQPPPPAVTAPPAESAPADPSQTPEPK